MSIVALLLKSSEQVDLRSKNRFLDDNLYGDADLPMRFSFVNDVDQEELEKTKQNDFIASGKSDKGFSQALDIVNDEAAIEGVVKQIDQSNQ